MKKKLILASLLFAVFASSCSDSSSDEFDNGNAGAAQKYLKTLTITPTDGSDSPSNFAVNYDSSGRVSSITDGVQSNFFVYQNSNLANITGEGEPFMISELYQAPYEAYEIGEVLNYDSKGNPTDIRLFQENRYDGEIEEFTAKVTYDTAPNTFFYTLKAAGIIDVLDNVELNLNMQSLPPEIIKAKLLLPVNNPTKVVIKNASGSVVSTTQTDYVYTADKYPTSATITETSEEGVSILAVAYTYKQ